MKNKLKFSIYSLLLMGILIILSSCQGSNTIKDLDGNVYKIVTIGTQVWMGENLKTTKYTDGSLIPNVTDGNTWNNQTIGAYCDYENNPENSTTFGRLYNYYAATDSRGICPKGWHVSSLDDWNMLITYLGGKESNAGGKLKEIGTTHWKSPNTDATNETGFTALPGGKRIDEGLVGFELILGQFTNINTLGYWWNINMSDKGYKGCDEIVVMRSDESKVYTIDNNVKNNGYSVRCIKD